jgi:hypothetical protein
MKRGMVCWSAKNASNSFMNSDLKSTWKEVREMGSSSGILAKFVNMMVHFKKQH